MCTWFSYLVEWFKQNPSELSQWAIFLATAVVGALAVWIGITQNSINRSLQKIEDSVEVFAYASLGKNKTWFLLLLNVGRVQLYLYNYKIGDIENSVNFALVPAGQQQNAWFAIDIPNTTEVLIVEAQFEDQFQRRWESHIDLVWKEGHWETTVHRIQNISA